MVHVALILAIYAVARLVEIFVSPLIIRLASMRGCTRASGQSSGP